MVAIILADQYKPIALVILNNQSPQPVKLIAFYHGWQLVMLFLHWSTRAVYSLLFIAIGFGFI